MTALGSRREHAIGVVILLLAAVTMVTAVSADVRMQRAVACQAQFNQDYRAALAERTTAANDERGAQRNLLSAITDTDPSNNRPALDQYRAILDAADAQRAANPVPVVRECR